MNPFEYAENFFSNDYLPQQVTLAFALLLVSLSILMAGLVLIRRAFGQPHRSTAGAPPPARTIFEKYEIGARLWHVGLVGILGALVISGLAFYLPGSVPGPVPVLKWSWLWVHLAFAVFFMFGILVHIIKVLRLEPRQMWFDRHDGEQLVANTRYYLGLPHRTPKLAKYALSSKVFHIVIALLSLLMIVTGISLSMDTLGWKAVDQSWQRGQRLLHDLGTYGFVAVVVGHVFWQLLKSRSQLKTMVTGTLDSETFAAHHDWDRWKPDVVARTTDARKVDHGA